MPSRSKNVFGGEERMITAHHVPLSSASCDEEQTRDMRPDEYLLDNREREAGSRFDICVPPLVSVWGRSS
jgi:hypothetical protein